MYFNNMRIVYVLIIVVMLDKLKYNDCILVDPNKHTLYLQALSHPYMND